MVVRAGEAVWESEGRGVVREEIGRSQRRGECGGGGDSPVPLGLGGVDGFTYRGGGGSCNGLHEEDFRGF